MSSCSQEKWLATTAATRDLVLFLTGFASARSSRPSGRDQTQLTRDDADQLGRTNDHLGDLSAAQCAYH
jgi:hypothetical protein